MADPSGVQVGTIGDLFLREATTRSRWTGKSVATATVTASEPSVSSWSTSSLSVRSSIGSRLARNVAWRGAAQCGQAKTNGWWPPATTMRNVITSEQFLQRTGTRRVTGRHHGGLGPLVRVRGPAGISPEVAGNRGRHGRQVRGAADGDSVARRALREFIGGWFEGRHHGLTGRRGERLRSTLRWPAKAPSRSPGRTGTRARRARRPLGA